MAVKLNKEAVEHAKKLIKGKLEVAKHHSDWSEDKPTQDEVVKYLNTHDMQDYALWFLGINTDFPEESKERYDYPTGDLKIIHISALKDSLKHARHHGHTEIENAAKELIDLIETTIK